MKKFKRIAFLGLVFSISLFSLVGCSPKTGVMLPSWAYDGLMSEDSELVADANLRIMSYNVLVAAWGGDDLLPESMSNKSSVRAEMLSKVLAHYTPDVVGLQEFCESWHKSFKGYMGDYAMTLTKNSNYTTIIYNTKTVKLLESDVLEFSKHNSKKMRYVNWALFERLESKQKFIVLNSHLDFGKNKDMQEVQIKEYANLVLDLEKKYNCPIFALGDYNAMEKNEKEASDIYKSFMDISKAKDAKYDYDNIVKLCGSECKYEDESWDHIFIKGDSVLPTAFNVLSNKFYTSLSDHYPIYVDVKLS